MARVANLLVGLQRYRKGQLSGIIVVACLVGGMFAAVAMAASVTTVYKNKFPDKAATKALKGPSSKDCSRKYVKKKQELRVKATQGKLACEMTLPVVADGPQPDHQIAVRAKIGKSISNSGVRKRAHITTSLRSGNDTRYELRIYPDTRRYQLVRFPKGGQLPLSGKDSKIKRLGGTNNIVLRAFNDRLVVKVNGATLVNVVDTNTGAVDGTRIRVGVVNGAKTNKTISGVFRQVTVGVPTP